MLFNSLQYALFLPLAILLYHAAPVRAKLGVLLFTSFLFYASWSPIYLLLIIAQTALNYALGLVMARATSEARGRLLWLGVILNLGILGYYKYITFLVTNLLVAAGWLGASVQVTPPSPILPLGLSFFTFEFVHYLVDVRKGHPPVRSFVQFALFAAFFPTQVAGPIKRYEQFVPQMERPARFSWPLATEGLRLLVVGLFKKVAIADNLAPLVEVGFHQVLGGAPTLNPLDAWLAVAAFSLQIYFDFSGYTDMGRGSAMLLGYTVPENFLRPYLAANISDFWRRWHISLSTWLRDYLYIALGGNRDHRDRNLFLTMVLGGLWHGANWTFIIWGAYHGLLLLAYWRIRNWVLGPPRRAALAGGSPERPAWLSGRPLAVLIWLLTLVLACVGWVPFRAESLEQTLAMLGSMVGLGAGAASVLQPNHRLLIVACVVGTLAVEWVIELRERRRASEAKAAAAGAETGAPGVTSLGVPAVAPAPARVGLGAALRPIALTLLFMLTLLVQPSTAPRFIYFQF
jgi:alginate O-acetyltransferase complex protein AlgI